MCHSSELSRRLYIKKGTQNLLKQVRPSRLWHYSIWPCISANLWLQITSTRQYFISNWGLLFAAFQYHILVNFSSEVGKKMSFRTTFCVLRNSRRGTVKFPSGVFHGDKLPSAAAFYSQGRTLYIFYIFYNSFMKRPSDKRMGIFLFLYFLFFFLFIITI